MAIPGKGLDQTRPLVMLLVGARVAPVGFAGEAQRSAFIGAVLRKQNTGSETISRNDQACQFLIVLANTDPLVWRRVLVPETTSFWGLHVAIQDAMGWLDCHLHEFTLIDYKTSRVKRIGIPDDEMPDSRPCLPGWKVPIMRYLKFGMAPLRYRYDFGDDWQHAVEFENVLPLDSDPYPRCVGGAGACPPENVGGTHGYAEFLSAIQDRSHPEHAAMLEWVGGEFHPTAFHAGSVHFDDPQKRWQRAFGGEESAV